MGYPSRPATTEGEVPDLGVGGPCFERSSLPRGVSKRTYWQGQEQAYVGPPVFELGKSGEFCWGNGPACRPQGGARQGRW